MSIFYIRVNISTVFLFFFSYMLRMQPKCAVDSWKESMARSVSLPWLFVTVRYSVGHTTKL